MYVRINMELVIEQSDQAFTSQARKISSSSLCCYASPANRFYYPLHYAMMLKVGTVTNPV